MENQSITIKKLHLIIIIVVSILVGSLGTVLITKINNNSVGDVDLFDGLYMDVSGKTSDGTLYLSNSYMKKDYDSTDSDLSKFYSTITYKANKEHNLSNGDKVKVTANFNKRNAQKLGIKESKSTKVITIKGLTENYRNPSDIGKKNIEKLFKYAKRDANKEIVGEYGIKSGYSLKGAYYLVEDKTTKSNSVWNDFVFVYKLNETYKSVDYVFMFYENIDSDFFKENSSFDPDISTKFGLYGEYRGDYNIDYLAKNNGDIEKSLIQYVNERSNNYQSYSVYKLKEGEN